MSVIKCADGDIKFHVYEGSIIESMPVINKKGYRAFSAFEIMLLKVNAPYLDLQFNNFLNSHYLDTISSVIYHPDGRIKFVRESKSILSLNNKTPLTSTGAIRLAVKGTTTENIEFSSYPDEDRGVQLVFSRDEIEKYANVTQGYSESMRNLMLRAIALDNGVILEDFIDSYISRMDFSPIAISTKIPKYQIEKIITFNPTHEITAIDATLGFFNSEHSRLLCSYNSFDIDNLKTKKKK